MVLYPLSHPQKRIWIVENIYPHTSLYNIGGVAYFKEEINLSVFQDSIHQLVRDNKNLRIRLEKHNDKIFQYIHTDDEYSIPFLNFEQMDFDSKTWLENHFQEPFEMLNSPLFQFFVFRDSNGLAGYYFKGHHIICDGWSMKFIAEKVLEIYEAKMKGDNIVCDEHSYLDYLEKEKKYFNSSRFVKDKVYWVEKFSDLSNIVSLKSSENTKAQRQIFMINPERSQQIRDYSKNHSISIAAFFTTLLFIYLARITNNEDCILGTPVLNRSGPKEKATLGMFTSTMPLKLNVNKNLTASEFMIQVNKELTRCFFHQKYPYDILVDDIQLKQQGFDQLFQYCINYSNASLPEWCGDIKLETFDLFANHQIYTMQVFVKDWFEDGSIRVDFEYKTEDFTSTQIEELIGSYNYLINQTLEDSDYSIKNSEIIEPSRKKKILYEWNTTNLVGPQVSSIVECLQKQVALTPERIALEHNGKSWTYGELNKKSNQLAHFLKERNIGTDDIVAILATHSLEAIMAMWAVLKAGAAFLPIEPTLPAERIQFFLKDSNISVIITNMEINHAIPCELIRISPESSYHDNENNLELVPESHELAYIIYTSGSTGVPKGVMVEHKGLLNYVWWARETYVKDYEVFPIYSSFSFDLTITSIFTPLVCGSKAIIYNPSSEDFVLNSVISNNQATVIKLTPSHLRLIKEQQFSNSAIKSFIVGGEDLKIQLVNEIINKFNRDIEIYNEYGPTETVVGCTIHKFDTTNDTHGSVKIGKPIYNTQVYVLDNELRPVPILTRGEIYVSGFGVARGYLNRTDITKERFLNNPFLPNSRMYKTGDIGFYDHNGDLHYLGRADDQRKINGYRIELLEVENAITGLKEVKDAVVIKHTLQNETDLLVAYVELYKEATVAFLKRSLSLSLPSYMVPSHFIVMERLPVTVNGKIDRKSLPAPDLSLINSIFEVDNLEIGHIVLSTVKEVLKANKISYNDNFFFLGGDSIKAIQISSILEKKGIQLKAKDILLYPIIREHAEMAVRFANNGTELGVCKGTVLPSPINSWFLEGRMQNKDHYLQSINLDAKMNITYEDFVRAVSRLVELHDSLRLVLDEDTRLLKYEEKFPIEKAVQYIEISETSSEISKSIVEFDEQLKENIKMTNAPLVRFVYFHTPSGYKISIVAHHLIIDGVSWRIILEDLHMILESIFNDQQVYLRAKTHSYQDWTNAISIYIQSEAAQSEREYWDQAVSAVNYIEIASEIANQNATQTNSAPEKQREIIDIETTEIILTTANEVFQSESNELIIAALSLTLQEISKEKRVSFLLEGHGRESFSEQLDVTRTVGWFTSIYPVNIEIEETDLKEQLFSISNQLRTIPLKGMGYGIHYYLTKMRGVEESKLVRLNYLGELDNSLDDSYFEFTNTMYSPDVSPSNGLSCLLDINIFVLKKQFHIDVQYHSVLFSHRAIQNFLQIFNSNLRKIASYEDNGVRNESKILDLTEHKMNTEDLDALFS